MNPFEIRSGAVVCVGDFNPAAFQPFWFAEHGLLSKAEASEAKIEVIHPKLAQFLAGNLKVTATDNTFVLATERPSDFGRMKDAALGVLRLLPHTPLRQLGLNNEYHYRFESEDAWHGFGHKVAPKAVWNGLLEKPGLLQLTMMGQRTDGQKGRVNVMVHTSNRVVPNGVFFQVNDHTELGEGITAMQLAIAILEKGWTVVQDEADRIVTGLIRAE